MHPNNFNKLLATHLWPEDIQDWIYSLPPLGVAFAFYIIYIISSDIEPKGLYIAYGATAGFIGLESYWIVRGLFNNHASTIIMGVIGIIIALCGLGFYMSII